MTPNKIPQEIEELKNVNEWVKECDVDGRMINFEFFDSDIEDLKNAIKRDFKAGQLQKQDECLRLLGFSNKEAGSKDEK